MEAPALGGDALASKETSEDGELFAHLQIVWAVYASSVIHETTSDLNSHHAAHGRAVILSLIRNRHRVLNSAN